MQSILGMNRKYRSPPGTSVLRNRGIIVCHCFHFCLSTLGSELLLLPNASRASLANHTAMLRCFQCPVEVKRNLDLHVHGFMCMHMIRHSPEQKLTEPSFKLEASDLTGGTFTSLAIKSGSGDNAIAYGRSST